MTIDLIDLHHHARPAAFFDAIASTGTNVMANRPFPPAWSIEGALAFMDQKGISAAVVSAPDADLLYRDQAVALRLSRLLNELYAEAVQLHPRRFGGFASLPMPHLEDSLKELAFAYDVLKLDGVMLSTSYEGEYLGSEKFDSLLAELNRRKSIVHVHPATSMGIAALKLDFPPALLEYAFDTTRCIINLLRHRANVRFPEIRFIFSHGGGAAPFIAPRLSMLRLFTEPGHGLQMREDQQEILQGLRSFYYDVALCPSDQVLEFLEGTIGIDRMVFGSDWPPALDGMVQATIDSIRDSSVLSEESRRAIGCGNAIKLFPRFNHGGR